MSGLKQDISGAEEKARARKMLYVFIAICAICGIIGAWSTGLFQICPESTPLKNMSLLNLQRFIQMTAGSLPSSTMKEGPSYPLQDT